MRRLLVLCPGLLERDISDDNGRAADKKYPDGGVELEVEGSQEEKGQECHPHKIGNQDIIPVGEKQRLKTEK